MTDPDHARVADLVMGCWRTQAVHAAVSLGIADALGEGEASAAAVARALGLHPRATFRLLRALAGLGLCEHRGQDRFALTGAGRLLRTDAPDSLAPLARHWGGRTWPALGQLDATVRTGAAYRDPGRSTFSSLEDEPEQARVFNLSMASQTGRAAPAIVAAWDFSSVHDVIDVGGGYGALLAAVLRAHPHLRGATADLAYMEADARAWLAGQGVGDRARFLPADLFAEIPAGGDVYLLKYIVHDWDDADAVAVLRNTAAAAGARARILVIERLAPERASGAAEEEAVLRGDIQMMVSTGGVERTEAEYDALFAAAGLRRTRTIATAGVFSILEAAAA